MRVFEIRIETCFCGSSHCLHHVVLSQCSTGIPELQNLNIYEGSLIEITNLLLLLNTGTGKTPRCRPLSNAASAQSDHNLHNSKPMSHL